MIAIYLCDDDDAVREQIQKEIDSKILIEDYDMRIAASEGNAETFLEIVRRAPQKRNIYFLDVDLKDENYDGFLLGKEIRRTDPHATLIYITSFENLAYRTFQYHLEAFDYIIKNPENQKESIDRCLESLCQRLQDEKQNDAVGVYSVKIGNTLKHVPIQDILYFETSSRAHHVILHTDYSRIDFVGDLNEIEQQMGNAFIRTHRSYLAAVDKITEIDLKHGKAKVGQQECLVSRNMKSAVLKRISGKY